MARGKVLSRSDPRSPQFKKEEFPFYWIAHVQSVYLSEMERALKPLGIDTPRWRILFVLKEAERQSISTIAEHALGKLSTITKIVYRMRADGLVDTETAAYDGRVTEVILTRHGRDMIHKIDAATAGIFERAYKDLSKDQVKRINVMLQMILANLNDRA